MTVKKKENLKLLLRIYKILGVILSKGEDKVMKKLDYS